MVMAMLMSVEKDAVKVLIVQLLSSTRPKIMAHVCKGLSVKLEETNANAFSIILHGVLTSQQRVSQDQDIEILLVM